MGGDESDSAFRFTGRWPEFIGIASTNLLLTVATLGLFRFWATARERRYLWSRTEFVDDALEWTGTGRELFVGFLVAAVVFAMPLAAIFMIVQGVLLHENKPLAAIVTGALLLAILLVAGLAQLRGLRYRLSRTHWHGIGGGSDDQGLRYALTSFWKSLVAYAPLGLLIPWATVTLMRRRWNAMSFGQHEFRATPRWVNLIGPYLMLYALPLIIVVFPALFVASFYARGMTIYWFEPGNQTFLLFYAIFLFISFVFVMPFIALFYHSALTRELCDNLTIGSVSFQFDAWMRHWVWLFLGNAAISLGGYLIVIVPLAMITADAAWRAVLTSNLIIIVALGFAFAIVRGFTAAIVRYRRWRFFVRHLEAYGDVDSAGLRRSPTRAASQGEGLLDALEMGAI